MLDDNNVLNDKDPYDMIGLASGTWQQLTYEFNPSLGGMAEVKNIVYCGMGGSALSAVLMKAWRVNQLKLPFEIVRGYNLPGYVDENSLVIVSSYSGNTEETLSCFEQATNRSAKILTMASGGKLAELARQSNLPFIPIPQVAQPRVAVFYMLRALAEVLELVGADEGLIEQLETASKNLEQSTAGWSKTTPTEHNYAKQLALKTMGKNIEIIGGPLTAGAAYKWKINFNESSKNTAFWNELPEFNHNEFIGWTSHPVDKPFMVFELISSFERPEILKRFEVSNRLLSGMMPAPEIINCYGDSAVEQILWAVMLGDHVSVYLGIINGQNPAPVALVEKLKEELKK